MKTQPIKWKSFVRYYRRNHIVETKEIILSALIGTMMAKISFLREDGFIHMSGSFGRDGPAEDHDLYYFKGGLITIVTKATRELEVEKIVLVTMDCIYSKIVLDLEGFLSQYEDDED